MDELIINQLLGGGAETRSVDYKCSMAWDETTKAKFLKHIMAFANAGGGQILLGYNEKATAMNDKRTGVEDKHLETWDVTRIAQYINKYCVPNIDIEILRLQDKNEKIYVVLRIPSLRKSPHFSTSNLNDTNNQLIVRKGAIYIRTKEKTCEEVTDFDDWERLLQHCLMQRRQELLSSFEQIIGARYDQEERMVAQGPDLYSEMDEKEKDSKQYNKAHGNKDLVFMEVIVRPKIGARIEDLRVIKNALQAACVDFRGWPFIFYLTNSSCHPQFANNRVFAVNDEPFIAPIEFSYWAFYYGAGVFYSKNITIESSRQSQKVFDPVIQNIVIAEAAFSFGKLYDRLNIPLNSSIELCIRYSNTLDIKIKSYKSHLNFYANDFADNNVSGKFEFRLIDFVNDSARISSETMMALLEKMGCQRIPNTEFFAKEARDHLAKPFQTH